MGEALDANNSNAKIVNNKLVAQRKVVWAQEKFQEDARQGMVWYGLPTKLTKIFKTDLKTLEKKVEENDKSFNLELVALRSNDSKPDTALASVKTKQKGCS